ncbi:hypothetical protein CUJ83_10585 [Methanocella sp. CWC-04]|uniref:Uncharacterized protein n=1 Tax=Methanooceanicella nereidis TaxID=2052831 RepID=A0AAP2RF60_9EURY|nr:hypothetical protein [Methanocella sp. CWC-04]MCD1295445.1 hypothetical protein [Methanocella sp. CWC-04]
MPEDTYTLACRSSFKLLCKLIEPEKIKKYFMDNTSDKMSASLRFAGIEAEPWEVLSFAFICSVMAFLLVVAAGIGAFFLSMMDSMTSIVLALCAGIVPLLAFIYTGEYPKRKAAYMKVHSLGDVPEVISYIVMSMKLNPNLEIALTFAASNSKRQLARDVKKLMWDIQMRAYDSIDDALTAFAGNWGSYSEHFKRSIFLIKSSTCEKSEAMRTISLNRSLEVVLSGTKGLMEKFSGSLHSPTLILYSIFVMIPLAMVAMLPAAAVVGFRVNSVQLVLLYDVIFPLITLLYAHSILMGRPAAFSPPEIPDSHPDISRLPRIVWGIVSVICGACVCILYLLVPQGLLPLPNSIFIVWGIGTGIFVYCIAVYGPYKRIRDNIAAMEADFADSLFVLGRRISEGRSPEEAFAYTSKIFSGTAIGNAYFGASFNIRCLRTTLNGAVLDPEYGAFSRIYSDRIKTTISMLIESAGKSGYVAGNSVIRLADHLKELQSIEDEIKKMLMTMTGMLKTTCVIFAPFIGGITLALSEAVTNVVKDTIKNMQGIPESARSYFPMVPEFSAPLVSPDEFVLIVGIYLIFLVIILLRFVNGIEHGDDRYEFMYSLGNTLPISITVFTLTTAMAGTLFQGML